MEYVAKRSIDLPLSGLLDLELYLMETRPGVKPDAFIADLIRRWLAVEKERLALLRSGPAMHGFQWKNVFLPDGTSLRTSYHQTTEFAKVVGDHILSPDGQTLTPSSFANRHTIGRNAWRCIWLRFPGDQHWSRAVDLRARSQPLAQPSSR